MMPGRLGNGLKTGTGIRFSALRKEVLMKRLILAAALLAGPAAAQLPATAAAQLPATAARGTNRVIIECPASVYFAPYGLTAPWQSAGIGSQPFVSAKFYNPGVVCTYGDLGAQGNSVGSISHPTPLEMTCQVNPSNPRQYDCVPGPGFGKTLQPVKR
jgi:hypothetical protein